MKTFLSFFSKPESIIKNQGIDDPIQIQLCFFLGTVAVQQPRFARIENTFARGFAPVAG